MRYLIICLALLCSSCTLSDIYKSPATREFLSDAETIAEEIIDPDHHPITEKQETNPIIVFLIGGCATLAMSGSSIYLHKKITSLANTEQKVST